MELYGELSRWSVLWSQLVSMLPPSGQKVDLNQRDRREEEFKNYYYYFCFYKIMEIESMLVNLRMEGVYLKELLSINWLCESGLVDNIELVVEEYRQTRGLLVCTESKGRNLFIQRILKCLKK